MKALQKKIGRRRAVLVGLLLGAAALVCLYMAAYTPVSNWFHSRRMEELIAAYDRAAAALPEEEREALLQAARDYNRALETGTHFRLSGEELEAYANQLDITGTGMMGYLRIPKLRVCLPIFHTSGAEVLEEAVGHLPGSSLPVGGDGCHTVLCGHRDLPTAYLFHDLDKLKIGDSFSLTVLDETVSYRVDQVRVVFPRQVDDLAIQAGSDLCTLVTCHPHGSTTYRLLVRGSRIGCKTG